jgi:hypothetical protein
MIRDKEIATMAVTTYTDAQLLRDFRDLFRISLEEVDRLGISRRTWTRIEAAEERAHTRGVEQKIAQIRDLMALVGTMPYSQARAWAVAPLPGRRGKSPRSLILSGLLGLGGLLTDLHSRDDFAIL